MVYKPYTPFHARPVSPLVTPASPRRIIVVDEFITFWNNIRYERHHFLKNSFRRWLKKLGNVGPLN